MINKTSNKNTFLENTACTAQSTSHAKLLLNVQPSDAQWATLRSRVVTLKEDF